MLTESQMKIKKTDLCVISSKDRVFKDDMDNSYINCWWPQYYCFDLRYIYYTCSSNAQSQPTITSSRRNGCIFVFQTVMLALMPSNVLMVSVSIHIQFGVLRNLYFINIHCANCKSWSDGFNSINKHAETLSFIWKKVLNMTL